MKQIYCCLPFVLFSLLSHAQGLDTPCSISGNFSYGICIDPPGCFILHANPEGGVPPYQFLWNNGSTAKDAVISFENGTQIDTCLSVWITDASGCKVLLADRYVGPNSNFIHPAPIQLGNDTLTLNSAGGSFDLHVNDDPLARDYVVVQAPIHGAVSLNADGTGTYTPAPGWCGPDYFRYSATDTSNCVRQNMATVWIQPSPCGLVYQTKPDCNQSCGGQANFYQNGLLTPPLSYQWSNGSTDAGATGLCAGPVALTVTDALGAVQIFTAAIAGEQLTAAIVAPPAACNNSLLQLKPDIVSSGGQDFSFNWSGPGIYDALVFAQSPTLYCHSDSGKADFYLNVHAATGCSLSTSVEIPVLPQAKVSTTVFAPKCPGDTLIITSFINQDGTPPYYYSWSGPQGIQSNWPDLVWPDAQPGSSGSIFLTVTDANGCTTRPSNYVYIPQNCSYNLKILKDNFSHCSGGEIKLHFYLGTTGAPAPDEVQWTGPGGFHSTEASPVLQQSDPSMSGWYHVSVRFGNSWLQDSAQFNIAPNLLAVNSATIVQQPTNCHYPYDGIASFDVSAPPPYEVMGYLGSGFLTVNSNPFQVTGLGPDEAYVDIRKNGCITREYLTLETPAPVQVNAMQESCSGQDGSIAVQSANPVSIFWTFPNGSYQNNGPKNLFNLSPGTYTVAVYDSVTTCRFKDTLTLLPYLTTVFSVLDTPTCASADGVLLVIPPGNAVPPLTFEWNTGSSGNPLAGLPTGGYSLTLTDGNGCQSHRNTVLPAKEACIALVSGHVRANLSCVCQTDTNTVVFPFVQVCATDGAHTNCTYPDNSGYYSLALTEPGDYLVTATNFLPGIQGSCPSQPLTIGPDITRDTSGIDFYFCGNAASDRQISVYSEPARPGFQHFDAVFVRNNGFWTADTSFVTVQLSPWQLNPVFSIQPAQYNPATNQASWVFPKLLLYETKTIEIRSTIDLNAQPGNILTITGDISGDVPPDPFPGNNHFKCDVLITNSFDPNDKQVNPIGLGQTGVISPADSLLTYAIRFQNTGTDTAFTVVVRDTLDKQVYDLGSIEPLMSSHPYRLDLEQGHILVFTFNPILLPDSSTSQQGSSGYAVFRIRLRAGLPSGTAIQNRAAIYFDYNQPVITNTAGNTLLATDDPPQPAFKAVLAPNPADEKTTLYIDNTLNSSRLDIVLFNSSGQRLRQLYHSVQAPKSLHLPVEVKDLPAGVYFVELRSEFGRVVVKLVVV